MMEAALQGIGVALCPPLMFSRQLSIGAIRQPFELDTPIGSYWLTRQKSRSPTPAMELFSNWILTATAPENLASSEAS